MRRAHTTAAAAAKQSGSHARGHSSPPPSSSTAHRSRTLGANAGSRHSGSPAPSKSVRVPGAATAAQMLASSTHGSTYFSMRNGSSAFDFRASAGRASAAAAAKLPSSDRGTSAKLSALDRGRHATHSEALRGLDTVLEKQVLRSNPTALLPAALKRVYAPYRTSASPSSAAAAASTVDTAGRSGSPSRPTASAGSSYGSSGHRRAGKPAVTAAGTAGGYSTGLSGGTAAAGNSSSRSSSAFRPKQRPRQHSNTSHSEIDDGLQYLTNLFTLKRAYQAATQPQMHKHRAGARQVDSASSSRNSSSSSSRANATETYLGHLANARRPSSRNRDRSVQSDTRNGSRSDNQRRSPSPGRISYSQPNSGRDRSPLFTAGHRSCSSRSRPASVDGYSSNGGTTEQLWPSGYSKLRSVSAERVRRSERSEVTRSVEGRPRLQSSSMQHRHSVDAGSYARHLNRRSVDTGSYASRLSATDANRRSTVDTGGSSSSSWKVHAAAAELERRIQQYRTGRASPLDRKSLY